MNALATALIAMIPATVAAGVFPGLLLLSTVTCAIDFTFYFPLAFSMSAVSSSGR
jgi:hypothetical protein